ncbi:MAG: nuclear transport factor 2 family protein [Sphingobacteriales bacterium]|nr:nuclear transport factor 2 family protein [Sphingobacteriales bacterium]
MVFAQSKAAKQVEEAVNMYARAMIDANITVLRSIADKDLTYGHSGGHVEGKEEFLKKIETGQSDFVTMDITNQKIFMHKKTAIVRHHIECITNDNNKPGTVSLDVMTVWQKKSGIWIMIARQAVKPKI